MRDITDQIPGWLVHPGLWAYALGAGGGLMLALCLLAPVIGRRRPVRRRPVPWEDVATYIAAGIATVFALDGMFRVAGERLGMHGPERYILCGFLEIALLACALRARRNVKEIGRAGLDGQLVWAFAVLSGMFGASVGHGIGSAVRFSAPLVAAMLWERGLTLMRRREHVEREPKSIAWKWTTERLAVWLGLAEPAERTTTDVARARRIARITKVRLALAVLEQEPRSKRLAAVTFRSMRAASVAARLRNLTLGAVEHLQLGLDPHVMEEITRTVATVVLLPELTDPRTVGRKPEVKTPSSKAPSKRAAAKQVPGKPEPGQSEQHAVPEQRAHEASATDTFGRGDFEALADLEAAYRSPDPEEDLAERLVKAAADAPSNRDAVLAMRRVDPEVSHKRMAAILNISRQAVGQHLKPLASATTDGA